MSVMLYPCMLCVAPLMCLFDLCVACLTVFANCLVKQFAMCLCVVAILLLKECVCCACDPNERLSASSICFVCVFCMSEVVSSFRSLRTGSQVFALLISFLRVILHTMSLGKSL